MATNFVSAEVAGGDDVLASQYNNLRQDALESGGDFETTAGAGDTYTLAIDATITAYKQGQVFRFIADEANTGAATLNVNGIGAITIKKNVSSDLETGDILVNQMCYVQYDGTNFQLLLGTEAISRAQAALLTGGTTSNADSLHTHSVRLHTDTAAVSNSGTSETTIFSITVPGGTLSTANALLIRVFFSVITGNGASSTTVTLRLKYGGTVHTETFTVHQSASGNTGWLQAQVMGAGATNSQLSILDLFGITNGGGRTDGANTVHWEKSGGIATMAIDSTADQTLELTMQSSSAGATITARGELVSVVK